MLSEIHVALLLNTEHSPVPPKLVLSFDPWNYSGYESCHPFLLILLLLMASFKFQCYIVRLLTKLGLFELSRLFGWVDAVQRGQTSFFVLVLHKLFFLFCSVFQVATWKGWAGMTWHLVWTESIFLIKLLVELRSSILDRISGASYVVLFCAI